MRIRFNFMLSADHTLNTLFISIIYFTYIFVTMTSTSTVPPIPSSLSSSPSPLSMKSGIMTTPSVENDPNLPLSSAASSFSSSSSSPNNDNNGISSDVLNTIHLDYYYLTLTVRIFLR